MAPSNSARRPSEPIFPTLSGRLKGLPPERIASHQRARLEGAMVAAVARYGYAGTTVRELVALAGVSKSTFYQHFESKQECFLATFETIAAEATERISASYREAGDFRERLEAALATFMELVVEEPDAAYLVAVESLTLGAAGVERRERGLAAFAELVGQGFEREPAARQVSARTIRAIAAGVRGVVYRHLRSGRAELLPDLVPTLSEWALGYQAVESEPVRRAMAAAAMPQGKAGGRGEAQLDWRERPDSRRSRTELSQRERIVRAAAQLVVERGFETLSIPAISARAGTSNQTFYEHFSSKRDAFIAAFDASAAVGLPAVREAFEAAGPGPEAVGAGLRALLEEIAANELFARLAFFDLQTAGPIALDRADAMIDRLAAFLEPGAQPPGGDAEPRPLLQAISSGAWAVIQRELADGRAASLPELAPELTGIVLAPLIPARS